MILTINYNISDGNKTYEDSLIIEDTIGLPIGAKESDFEKVSVAEDEAVAGDAIILDAGGEC